MKRQMLSFLKSKGLELLYGTNYLSPVSYSIKENTDLFFCNNCIQNLFIGVSKKEWDSL